MIFDDNTKIIKTFIISFFFLIIFLIVKSLYFYLDLKYAVENDAKNKAYILKNYMSAMKTIYDKQFKASGLELNAQTLGFLPEHASSLISDEFFSKYGFYIRNVSDNPRNQKNQADNEELRAISYFNKHKKSEYFEVYEKNGLEYYQFAVPIYIKKMCLKCHGDKEDTLPLIQEKYETAFGYKEGDLRGIFSIKIPMESINEKINSFIKKELIYILVITVSICLLLFFIYRKMNFEMMITKKVATQYAMTDSLTGIYNRHFINSNFEQLEEFTKVAYYVVFFDLDHFKKVNDTYGHSCGDYVLKFFTEILKEHTRKKDVLCRYGGEEFILIINSIREDVLLEKLEQIRIRTSQSEIIFENEVIHFTTSIGYSEASSNEDFKATLDKADEALYLAKDNGRNRIEKYRLT